MKSLIRPSRSEKSSKAQATADPTASDHDLQLLRLFGRMDFIVGFDPTILGIRQWNREGAEGLFLGIQPLAGQDDSLGIHPALVRGDELAGRSVVTLEQVVAIGGHAEGRAAERHDTHGGSGLDFQALSGTIPAGLQGVQAYFHHRLVPTVERPALRHVADKPVKAGIGEHIGGGALRRSAGDQRQNKRYCCCK